MTAKVINRERAVAKLRALPDHIRAALKPALIKSADEHVAQMKRLAPRDSGALEKSIQRKAGTVTQTNSRVRGVGGDVKGDPDLTQNVVAGDDEAWYARLVEFGVGPSTGDATGNGARGPIPAQPFFYPTVRSLRKRTQRRIARVTKKAVKDAAS